MSDELRRLKAQQEAQSAQLHRLQMQMQAQGAQRTPPEQEYEEVVEDYVPQYVQVNPNEAMINSVAQQAAQKAAQVVQQNLQVTQQVQENVKTRIQRLVTDYPAIQQEDSLLTVRARNVYARIEQENPHLDEATKYELAVREAASQLGARPMSAPVEDVALDYLSPGSQRHNPSLGKKPQKNRLTDKIVQNAMAMGINVDPNSAEGKKNLAELNEYSSRFNADAEEGQYRYK